MFVDERRRRHSTRSRGKLCTGGRTPGERHSLNRIILNSAVNSVRSWKAEGEEKERDDEGDGNIASRKVDLWKARRLETCTTGLGRGVRDIRALLWENQSLQPMQRALRLLYINPNRCHPRTSQTRSS